MSIITITRGTKSGGLKLAKCLSQKLDYRVIGREEVISECAKKYNIMEEILRDKLEKSPNLWQKFTDDYCRYIIYVKCALLRAVKEDNIIYHGYSGQFLLKEVPHVLKLRIDAPLDIRVRPVMEELNYSYEQAVEYINKVDNRRKRWTKMVYSENWYDISAYDMWINLKNCSLDNVCNFVAKAIDHDDFRTTKDSQDFLENLSLACEVKAALVSDDKLWNNQQINVTSHKGVVMLRGSLKNKELLDLTIETALKVKGVQDCKSEITLLSNSLH